MKNLNIRPAGRFLFLCLLAFGFVALARSEARADPLVLTINNPVQSIPYNGVASFFGSLTSQTTETIIIDSYAFRRNPPIVGGGTFFDLTTTSTLSGMATTGDILLFNFEGGGAPF